MNKEKKPRQRPRWGVFPAAVAYCACGWTSGWHATKGCFRSAHGELRYHRERCPQGGLQEEVRAHEEGGPGARAKEEGGGYQAGFRDALAGAPARRPRRGARK
jgi:hypothetical protein